MCKDALLPKIFTIDRLERFLRRSKCYVQLENMDLYRMYGQLCAHGLGLHIPRDCFIGFTMVKSIAFSFSGFTRVFAFTISFFED